ncbi:hypothetical protein CHLRE_09g417000v5 [Chlamydomonas reinhardtii]|uniref:Glycosyl transferase CAP10 domain-containing protein n=1 Tax=Chlamydomonas reinhardtii TaxID=3055 RepID=A0A2K3DG13_CHLRE|nr:uncharacterized protein CHLRE_09g417000v5 [Chlamydomonas reinhardtii]PNW79483.1 hypothetical protein CHLRE_09g417000v5 [Chlamydomonas reinhardtii]
MLLQYLLAALLSVAVVNADLCGNPPPECLKYKRLLDPLIKKRDEWRAAGGVTEAKRNATYEDAHKTDGAWVTISNGIAYVESKQDGYETRLFASLLQLYRAMARLGRKNFPDVEFGINPWDGPRSDAWFNYCQVRGVTPSNWLWPDYSTMGWPEIGAASYAVLHQRIEEIAREMPFATRPNKLFWRGGGGPHSREVLVKKFADRTDIADIQKIPPFGGLWNALQRDPDYNISTIISKMEDFCKHKYVVYTEGNVYSFRLTTHFICGNVLIAHPMRFDGMASLMMEENKNWIIADPEWNDLEAIYRRLEANPAEAEAIANNNAATREILTEEGFDCYILESLKCYKDVMPGPLIRPPGRSWRYTPLEFYIMAKMKGPGNFNSYVLSNQHQHHG